ncbi:uncharacterized protein TNIN_417751 [Trichonephila inaurata madagascariensis]|uniref:Uncharacterized protein n=1 Tax=Trichonephila inaurata madagascariensis TaxID=2747483 RepID=A0A8X6JFC4_9ARAC|nr:uncharacterized protein TNIN_417751 [Trichonephila inaurata madagascariensis]
MKLIFRFIPITVASGLRQIYECTQRNYCIPSITVWCEFTGSFIIGPLFFETQCSVNGWKTVTVIAQRCLMLLREKVVPCLGETAALSTAKFIQDGATSHTANPVKEFLIQTFGEEKNP